MARTVQQIYDSMIQEKDNYTELSALQPSVDTAQDMLYQLSTPSKVGVWRLIFWVFSVAIWITEKYWDLFKSDVQKLTQSAIPGTAQWYQAEALKFQYGDTLQLVGGKYVYADTTSADALAKQIVKYAAVIETGPLVTVKVAKQSNGIPAKLDVSTGTELDTFTEYMKRYRRFAGVPMLVISDSADLIKLRMTIYYMAIIPLATIKQNVENAINAYFAALPFNGVVNKTKIIDAVQSVEGVTDCLLSNPSGAPQVKASGWGSYTNMDQNYNPSSGYILIDPTFPLSSTNQVVYIVS